MVNQIHLIAKAGGGLSIDWGAAIDNYLNGVI